MSSITANELKTRGISAVEESMAGEDEVLISVRGKNRYVVMNIEKYNVLRELELAAAVEEAKADYEAGRYTTGNIAEHIKEISE